MYILERNARVEPKCETDSESEDWLIADDVKASWSMFSCFVATAAAFTCRSLFSFRSGKPQNPKVLAARPSIVAHDLRGSRFLNQMYWLCSQSFVFNLINGCG